MKVRRSACFVFTILLFTVLTSEFHAQQPVTGANVTITVRDSPDYQVPETSTATKTPTPLRDVPQSVTVVTGQQVADQLMQSVGDVVRYVPGVTAIQGENNRDQVVIRGNSTSADFFVNGVRDDVQYYRDLYNLDRLEVLKGPNAMIFGRGGGGGVVNRVTKEAGFMPVREMDWTVGSFGNARATADIGQRLSDRTAFRVNGMYENSNSFRSHVDLRRFGINPTFTFAPDKDTRITFGYEHLRDRRVADRGIPSFQGRPVDVDVSTFYGSPGDSGVRANTDLASLGVERRFGAFRVRNRTQFGNYNRGYQNFVPGAVSTDKTQVALTAYNNATKRSNVFNQTDLTYEVSTGKIQHTFLGGTEFGHQLTNNFRDTGYFNNSSTSLSLPFSSTTITTPVTFRQSSTDAANHLKTNLAATYVQDQAKLSRYVQVIAGLRYDYFDLRYHNNRNGSNLRRIDNLASPRAGIVVKPVMQISIYGNYSVSYLPSSGDQFSSLTTVTQQVKPEKFDNYELGVKWDARTDLSLTTAVYRLDRTNTRSTDPNDPTKIVQTGSTRSNGYELGVNGRILRFWKIAGGYAYQDSYIASATTSAAAGAKVAQVPHHTFSLWNNYQILSKLGAGIGVVYRANIVRCGRQHGDPAGLHPCGYCGVLSVERQAAASGQRGKPVQSEIRRERGQQHEYFARLSPCAASRADDTILSTRIGKSFSRREKVVRHEMADRMRACKVAQCMGPHPTLVLNARNAV